VLPIICITLVLRLGHATGGARVLIRTCWGWLQRLVATWAEFQHNIVYYATDQCWKRQKACINAEDGHSEHLLWHCSPDIPVATHHNRFFLEPPMTTHNWLSSEPPTFGLQFVSFWDNVNSRTYVWVILLKVTFWISQGTIVTLTGKVDKSVRFPCQIFWGFNTPKIIKID